VTAPGTLDGCPACGTDVRPIWTRTSGGSEVGRKADTQGNACPTCGAVLRRDVGDSWHLEAPAGEGPPAPVADPA
jgi:hypothetical protein